MSNSGHPAWQLAYLVGSKPPVFGIDLEAPVYIESYGNFEIIDFCKNLQNDLFVLKLLRDKGRELRDNPLFCTDFFIAGRGPYPAFFFPSLALTKWDNSRSRDVVIESIAALWPGHKLYTYAADNHYQLYVDVIADYARDRADWVRVVDHVEEHALAHKPWLDAQRNSRRSLLDWNNNPKLKDWITL